MKLTTVILATSMLAMAPAASFAQSSPSPNNQSGPGVSPSVQSPTDLGAGGETGNTKATPERGTTTRGTTGSDVGGSMGKSGTSTNTTGEKTPMNSEKAK
jgi:hypothetical protein